MVDSSLVTKVELFMCARNLANMDAFSLSDPYCIVTCLNPVSGQYYEIGRTETIKNNLNPNWTKSIITDFYFETKQVFKFSVYDYDDYNPDELGSVTLSLGEIVGKGTIIANLSKKGKFIIRVEEVKNSRDLYEIFIRGIKLDKKDFFGKSDPYLIFYRSLGNNQWLEVQRTEIVKNTLDPIWKPVHTSAQKISNGDYSRPIKIECFDWDAVGSHDLIGIAEVTLENLVRKGFKFDLRNPFEKKVRTSGTIEISEVFHKKILSFIDYLRSGTQISFSIAIDFTASNGEYSNPSSLHHTSYGVANQYERAIWEVGTILEAYDSDKLFPVFGFGGVPVGERTVNHSFPLTFDRQNPYVAGVQGIIGAYHQALTRVSLSGPTCFHHIIDNVAAVARSSPPQQMYTVLLILTDGEIMDMNETITSIINCSGLPMSIIIVGVGNANFSSMEALDCDSGFLTDTRGKRAVRDIVQFVPFNKFGGNPVALAAEVLKEVPKQLTEFMEMIRYVPILPEEIPLELIAPIQENLPPLNLPNLPNENREEIGDPAYEEPSAPDFVPDS